MLTALFLAASACSESSESTEDTDEPAAESGDCEACASDTETGAVELDAMLAEARDLESAIDEIRANLDAQVVELKESWGLESSNAAEVDADVVAQLMSGIAASVSEATGGTLVLDFVGSTCTEAMAVPECTGASIEFTYELVPGLGDDFEADFNARMADLETRSVAMLNDAALLRAILEGDLDGGGPDIESPLTATLNSLQGVVAQGTSSELFDDLTDCEAGCAVDAITDQTSALSSAGTDATTLLIAHQQFALGLVDLEG